MGSATTAVSAKYLGHNYVGIDNCKSYLEYAEKRIEAPDTELAHMQAEILLHKVEKNK